MRRFLIVGLFVLLVLGFALPAAAQEAQGSEAFVVLSGRADVPEDEQVGDLVVFRGSSTVDGTVNGSLTAFDAPVTVSGRVDGDVVVFNGRVELASGAEVTGDVVSRDAPWWPRTPRSAGRAGGCRPFPVGRVRLGQPGGVVAGRVGSTLVVGLVLLWLLGRGAARIVEVGRTGIGPAIGWGLLLFFGLPILAVLALVTLVGIPLGLGLLAALAPIYALGYAATAWIVGRRILREPTAWVLAFLVGWGILRVLALVPILGGLVWFAAVAFGLGYWRWPSGGPHPEATRACHRLSHVSRGLPGMSGGRSPTGPVSPPPGRPQLLLR